MWLTKINKTINVEHKFNHLFCLNSVFPFSFNYHNPRHQYTSIWNCRISTIHSPPTVFYVECSRIHILNPHAWDMFCDEIQNIKRSIKYIRAQICW